ncbi:MAG: CocE/NonD family hydrolase [Acidimicrobiia bacterium]
MQIDPARRLHAMHVPMSDGVRLAVDVWLPVARVAANGAVSTVVRATRYHRASAGADSTAGDLWNDAGFAFVVVDARGTGASFGSRSAELGEAEIADYGEVIDWVAGQPWSNGRVGAYGISYEGQAAELMARLGNPHLFAVAALFSPYDPYRELFYPGGVATGARFARWMYECQLGDGVAGALERLAAATGRAASEIRAPSPVKPVDGPEGTALLDAAIGEHQGNVDMAKLLDEVPCRDDRVRGLDWQITSPAAQRSAIEASGVPMLVRVGWLDGAFVAGALVRFATCANYQEVEIGPWGHGGDTFADPLRPDGALHGEEASRAGQDRRLVEFFARYLERNERQPKASKLMFNTLATDQWQTVNSWPPPVGVRRWYPNAAAGLADDLGLPRHDATQEPSSAPAETVRCLVDPTASTGATNRWLAMDLGIPPAYRDRRVADEALLTFTTAPLPTDLHVVGFPVVALRLATSGTDGAVFVYLEAVAPDGRVTYLTEGHLRFSHRKTSGPVRPAGLGVPRSFARADRLDVTPGEFFDLEVDLLPISASVRAGVRIRIAIGGHDADGFTRYGPPDETFTLELGDATYLEVPLSAQN